ncbi:MAG: o-succinylbenzoate synthase [Bacteroidia bacterium]|nr:o-succinylbenzoate synthase [Bacteroidia bacterium]NNF31985.1 o-succinylbenzoate synthase [Flavobacteriaceae bacterium]MBT8276177.1 o-succinylbenzoate synthase [Bacteroidia bacterium]NNJ81908.1 o-succinylbenzoate synthase [Flavobacteriaceae bacterium]NNK52952.1 o-succinylbenzoate synthase [Flavobacteriaceae bacterium]
MTATFQKHILHFKRASGTSRGVLTTKDTWFLILKEDNRIGIGECGMFKGLSADDRPDFEEKLRWVCENISLGEQQLYAETNEFPAIRIGLETAFRSIKANDPFQLFPSEFSKGAQSIPINGLIWMGDESFMKDQISEKLKAGFSCIKMKIGAIDFETELAVLDGIRKEYESSEVELRVDANGAFKPFEALEKLKRLSEYQLHSIEQPIKAGQPHEMARLCEETPLPIALDEELIGVANSEEKRKLLHTVHPQYIILKPTLVGGFRSSDEWISIAEETGAGWWITSALESNVGLNAISQYTFVKNSKLPQGLGTGSLFTNNIPSPLEVKNGTLRYRPEISWKLNLLNL